MWVQGPECPTYVEGASLLSLEVPAMELRSGDYQGKWFTCRAFLLSQEEFKWQKWNQNTEGKSSTKLSCIKAFLFHQRVPQAELTYPQTEAGMGLFSPYRNPNLWRTPMNQQESNKPGEDKQKPSSSQKWNLSSCAHLTVCLHTEVSVHSLLPQCLLPACEHHPTFNGLFLLSTKCWLLSNDRVSLELFLM